MRTLIRKDVLILRRSPLLVALLVGYPLLVALLLGLALSRGPEKPRVAIYNGLENGGQTLRVGGTEVDPRDYADELFKSVEPVEVDSREEAIAKVRSGDALAAIVVPEDLLTDLQRLVALNTGARPTVEVLYSARDPLKRQLAEQAIDSRVAELNRAVADKLTKVAAGYIGLLLRGGDFSLLGQTFDVVGLERSKRQIDAVARSLPQGSERRRSLEQVSRFAGLAIENLDLSTSILSSVGSPVKVERTEVSGSASAPLDAYAVAVAVTLSLMLIGVLLTAGLLAMEREENTIERLLRGLTTPARLAGGKVVVGALCATAAALLLTAGISVLFSLDWARAPLWLVAFTAAGLGCSAFGTGIGALTRDIRAASLLAILISMPLAFLALVPDGAVAPWLGTAIDAISAVFPFEPALAAVDRAINGGQITWPLVHLFVVAVAWASVATLALRRTA